MAKIVKDLGVVTAYAYAVEGGYTGTEAEFEELLGNIGIDLETIENLTASASGLPAGSSPTASYSNGNIAFGIPKGDTGETGATGPEGPTGNGIASIAKTGTSGLVDTYTITYTNGNTTTFTVTNGETVAIDTTLTHSGEAADAKATGDAIDEVKGSLNDKANSDGSYEQMTVGNAEQLVSTVFTDDSEPYNFRTAGGNADIGDRLYEKIVGGSLAWNQLFPILESSATKTENGVTITDNRNGTYTVITDANGATENVYNSASLSVIAGHKYAWFTTPSGGSSSTYYGYLTGVNIASATSYGEDSGYGRIYRGVNTGTAYAVYVYVKSGTVITSQKVFKPQLFDLTAMFGPTIADYIYGLEQATAGAGVAWFRKLFPKDYYAYDAGSLQSVQAAKHVTVGFNQMNPDNYIIGTNSHYNANVGAVLSSGGDSSRATSDGTNPITVNVKTTWAGVTFLSEPLLRNTTYKNNFKITANTNSNIRVTTYLLDKNNTVIYRYGNYSDATNVVSATISTTIEGLRFAIFVGSSTAQKVTVENLCLHLHWDGERDGEYEPYVKHEYPLDDSLTLRGIPKLDASNHLYYDGDTYEPDGTVTRKYGIVDLGTLNYVYESSVANTHFFTGGVSMPKLPKFKGALVSSLYIWKPNGGYASIGNMEMCVDNSESTPVLRIKNDSYDNATTFKAAMSGVYLVYELATPTTESADPFQSPQVVDDFGTEEYVDAGVTASPPTRDVAIPVGHESQYSANLRAKLEMAPDSPSDGDGDYLVRQTSGENEYVKYVSPVPTLPSEDGTYSLKVTVSGSTKTLSWVADT